MVSEVLPDVPWVQMVFTIPKMLRPLFLWDRTLYGVFHPAPENLDFAPPLEDLFREELFKVLLRREKITEERVELLRSWRHSGFRVDSSRRIPQGDRNALESLLQYFERAPVALSRLEYLDDGRVLYRGNFHPSLRRD